MSCASAAASFLKETVLPALPEGQRGIYMIGQESLELELQEQGLKWTGGTVSGRGRFRRHSSGRKEGGADDGF